MEGKTIVITGAGSGIGKSTALIAASRKAKVVVSDINQESGNETVNEIIKQGGIAEFIPCDVSDKQQVKNLFSQTVNRFQQLDCLVNNAGVTGKMALLHEYPDDIFDQVLAINLKGVFYCLQEGLKVFINQGNAGSIVNVSSISGLFGSPTISAYSATKHAVVGLTKTAAKEYGKQGIRVNAICPALTKTPMADFFGTEAKSIESGIPLGRLVEPEEVAQAIVWLCSDDSSFVNGVAMPLDGGMKV